MNVCISIEDQDKHALNNLILMLNKLLTVHQSYKQLDSNSSVQKMLLQLLDDEKLNTVENCTSITRHLGVYLMVTIHLVKFANVDQSEFSQHSENISLLVHTVSFVYFFK